MSQEHVFQSVQLPYWVCEMVFSQVKLLIFQISFPQIGFQLANQKQFCNRLLIGSYMADICEEFFRAF